MACFVSVGYYLVMCGIFGYYGTKLDKNRFEGALTSIVHRGPDDSGVAYFDNCALGHKRLSIIDLSPAGHQPMFNSDKTVVLTFNGEIYNFLEIRKQLQRKYDFVSKTDSEVLIHAYEEWGVGCLQKFTGMFAFVIYDKRKDLLFGARDRLGEKPLKYYCQDGEFIFASEVKAILQYLGRKPGLDFEALSDYLTFQYVPAPGTGLKGIYKLPPAHYFIYRGGKLQIERYWDVDYSKKLVLNECEWQERILSELNRVVKERLISDVPIGCFLSGGVDSGAITAFMAKNFKGKIRTFSVGFDDQKYDETAYARRIAHMYDTDHHVLMLDNKSLMSSFDTLFNYFDEPMADDSILPTYLLSQFTRQQVTVALNGDGGDESFAGYSRYNIVKLAEIFVKLPAPLRLALFNAPVNGLNRVWQSKLMRRVQIFLQGLDQPFYRGYIDYNSIFTQEIKESLLSRHFIKSTKNHNSYNLYQEFYSPSLSNLDNALNIDLHTYLPENLLYKTDIASMAHALELRSPLLDHRFIELFAQMPADLKLKGHNKKYIFKKILVDAGILPKETVYRRKMGFSLPLDTWFGGEMKPYVLENALNPVLWEKGIFAKESLQKYVHDSYKGKFINGKNLFSLICLSKWLQKYS
jgi:asparagine synthase (glutamine-hydrolysing)